MKVTITAGNLGQGLQIVSRAVSSRTTLPILNNVLLQTADMCYFKPRIPDCS